MSGVVYSQPDGGWGDGGGFESCSDLDAEMCEMAPFCELTDEGCVESDGGWGFGDCGNGSFEWGFGDWSWEEGGFMLGDINIDQFINVTDIINQVNIIIEEIVPNDYESWAANMNIDEFIDILDVVSLVNGILGNRIISEFPIAELDENGLKIDGDIGGIQFNGDLQLDVSGNDIIVSANGITIIYNLNGKLDTKVFELSSNYSDLIVSSSLGKEVEIIFANQFSLNGNYPNPFNPQTTISYSVNIDSDVKIAIYNLLGEKVANLVDEHHFNGEYSIVWNASNNPSGLYFVEMVSGNTVVTDKIMLMK